MSASPQATEQAAPVRAAYKHRKGDQVVYRSGSGHEHVARVLRAHRDGDYTVEAMWSVTVGLPERLALGYLGYRYRVGPEQLSVRTKLGSPLKNLKHEA